MCEICKTDYASTLSELLSRTQKTETQLKDVHLVCNTCCGTASAEPVRCESLDCPWMYERKKIEGRTEALTTIQDLIDEMEDEWYTEKGYDQGDIDSDCSDQTRRSVSTVA